MIIGMNTQQPAQPAPLPENHDRDLPPGRWTGTSDQPVRHWSVDHPILMVVSAVGAGLGLAGVIGWLFGMLAYSISVADCSPNDGWCELGAALLAVAAGVVTGLIAYVVAGVTLIRRWREPGHRVGPIAAQIGIPLAVVGALFLLSMIGI